MHGFFLLNSGRLSRAGSAAIALGLPLKEVGCVYVS